MNDQKIYKDGYIYDIRKMKTENQKKEKPKKRKIGIVVILLILLILMQWKGSLTSYIIFSVALGMMVAIWEMGGQKE